MVWDIYPRYDRFPTTIFSYRIFLDVKAVDALQTNLSALHSCLTAVHSNVARLRQHITAWSHSPLYPCFVDADSIEQYLQRHNANMDASRQEMKKIIAENLRLFQQCGDNQHEGTSSEVDTQISIALAKRNRFKTFIGLTHQLKARANVSHFIRVALVLTVDYVVFRMLE